MLGFGGSSEKHAHGRGQCFDISLTVMHMGIPRNVFLCGNTAVNLPIKEQFEEGLMTWKASLGNYFCTYEIIFKEIFQLLWRTQINRRSCHSQIEKRKKKRINGRVILAGMRHHTYSGSRRKSVHGVKRKCLYIFVKNQRNFLSSSLFSGLEEKQQRKQGRQEEPR